MTKIRANKTLLGRSIEINGHSANDAESSKQASLVCCAVSMLAQTIAQNVYDSEDEGTADIIDITLKSGEAVINYITDSEELNLVVDGICKGFELLCDSYPQYVDYLERG